MGYNWCLFLSLSAFIYFLFSPTPVLRRSCSLLTVRKKICHSPPGGEDDELRGARLKAERPAGTVSPEPKRQMAASGYVRGRGVRREDEVQIN